MTKSSTQYLTIAQVAAMFAVSAVTVYHWRKGNSKVAPLPTAAAKKDNKTVRFLPSQVAAWAKKHKIAVVQADVSKLAATKPGPKPRAVTSEPAKKATKPAATKAPAAAKKSATKKVAEAPSKPTKAVTKPVAKKATEKPRKATEPKTAAPTFDASLEDSTASETN